MSYLSFWPEKWRYDSSSSSELKRSASAESPSISRSESGSAIGVRRIRAVREIVLETERKLQLIEVTDEIRAALGDADGAAAALVYIPHTTAGVAINERIDPDLVSDLENAFQRVVGDDWERTH